MRKALLVDDEQEICELLCAMLRRTGTQCHFAHTLAEGRAALEQGKYDAVFVDVNLPDGLGYELIPEVKAVTPDARCIAISAMDSERGRAVAAGADVFIPKPFDRETIFSSIRALGFQA
ncbi:MAG: response regulator transcription factor [Flavobacteriales bacterium]